MQMLSLYKRRRNPSNGEYTRTDWQPSRLSSMEPMREQIAPEIVQAIIAQAAARGLSVNDYLCQVLGLKNGESRELASSETSPRNEEMLDIIRRGRERLKDMPVRGSTEDTLRMIREARGGALWDMSQPIQTQSNAGAVVIDANILISICSKEPTKTK
jgi:hypothetical protein